MPIDLLDEVSAASMTPAEFRLWQASYFLDCYREASGPPKDNYPLMATCLDGCLFALVSVSDLRDTSVQNRLHAEGLFCLVKILRNATTHWMVVGAANKDAKLTRPFFRHVTNGNVPGFDSSRLKIHFPWLRELLLEQRKRAEKNKNRRSIETIASAERYVDKLESQNKDAIDIEDLLREAIELVGNVK